MRRSNPHTAISAVFSAAALCLGLSLCSVANGAATIFTPSNTPPPQPGVSVPAVQHAAPAPAPTPAAIPAAAPVKALAAAPAVVASPAPQTAPAPTARPAPRRRDRVVRMLPPLKICNVQVNAPKGEMRTAELAACIKK